MVSFRSRSTTSKHDSRKREDRKKRVAFRQGVSRNYNPLLEQLEKSIRQRKAMKDTKRHDMRRL